MSPVDKRTLNLLNAAAIILVLAVALLAWFYIRDQFMWAVLLIILILLFAGFVHITGKLPWQVLGVYEAAVAAAAMIILGFAWFYMRDQFCWAGYLVILLLVIALGLKLVNWFRDVVSIQVVIHKNEKGEGRKADEEDNKK
jgi:UDP-N-acetylmuramyl pentapeptide phosphotransferase/UDP-N-acetylglucosamine-1-phosphate transferase